MRKQLLVVMSASVMAFAGSGAEDMTVAQGSTLDVNTDTTYANLVVNGTLNVAEGVKLTCDTFILGDNLDHTQDRVAKMTVASNATVKVNNSETLSGSSYISTGYCKIGVNSRAELTLEGGSAFESGGRMILASACTGTTAKIVFVKVDVNDATLKVGGPLYFSGRRLGGDVIESAVVTLNGTHSQVVPRYVGISGDESHYANARLRFNGGKVVAQGWWKWGQQGAVNCHNCAQKFWLDSVNGNPIWISTQGGSNAGGFFNNPQSWLGGSAYYFSGTGALVLENTGTDAVGVCYNNSSLSSEYHFDQTGGVRLYGKVALNCEASYGVATNALKAAKLELAPGAEFDLAGHDMAIGALESVGKIVNSGTGGQVVVGGNGGDVVLSAPTLGEGVELVKKGGGKLWAPAGEFAHIDVQEGALDFGDRKSVGFPYYRFWVYGKSTGGGDAGGHCQNVKLSEIEFYDNGTSVRDRATHVSYSKYGSYERSPVNVFNDDTNLQWRCDWYNENTLKGSNSVFFVAHFGAAGKFDFVNRAAFGSSVTPEYEMIANAPVIGPLNEAITSYKYRTGDSSWFSWTVPEYFRLQGGIGDDEWIDLEDWQKRGRYTKVTSSALWSDEFTLIYPTNAVSVERLDLADGVEWTLDAAQTDLTVDTLNIAGTGTLRIENYGTVRPGKPLPVKYASISGDGNLKGWDLYVDGVKAKRWIVAANGRLEFVQKNFTIIFR